jgi:hypothetical protein
MRLDDRLDVQISRVLKEQAADSAVTEEQFAPYLEVAGELHRALEHAGPHLSTRAQVRHLNALREHARTQPRHQGIDWSFLRGNRMSWAAAALLALIAVVFLVRATHLLNNHGISAGVPAPTSTSPAQPTPTLNRLETAPAALPILAESATATPSPTQPATSTQTPSATLRATSAPSSTLEIVNPTLVEPTVTPEPEERDAPASETPAPAEPDESQLPTPDVSEQETDEPQAEETSEPQEQESAEPEQEERPESHEEETPEPEEQEDSEDEAEKES